MARAMLTLELQDHVWAQWRSGRSVRSIARDFGVEPARLRRYFAATGGVRARPAGRSGRQLSVSEREEISRGLAASKDPAAAGLAGDFWVAHRSPGPQPSGEPLRERGAVGDEQAGRRPSAVATLVERSSRCLVLVTLPGGVTTEAVTSALRDALRRVPPSVRRSLTWDRGREMAARDQLTAETGCPVYFCDPKSPWQRGTNEKTKRLLRQYLARSDDLRRHHQQDLDALAARLNNRPRKVLGWRTPAEVFDLRAATGHDVASTDPRERWSVHAPMSVLFEAPVCRTATV